VSNIGWRAAPRLSLLVPEIIALLGGIVSAVIIALPVNTFLDFIPYETVIVAPFVEEIAKSTGVLFLAVNYPSALSDKTRGLILGGLAGLGFAFTENLFYASIPGTDVVARALLPVPMHVMASGVAAMGFVYLAQDRLRITEPHRYGGESSFRLRNVASLLVVAVVIHAQFNMLSYFGYLGSSLGLMLAGFIYYRLGRSLPEDLQFFTVPGPLKLLGSSVRVRVLKAPFPSAPVRGAEAAAEQRTYCIMCGRCIPPNRRSCEWCGEPRLQTERPV